MGIVAHCPNGHRVKVKDEYAGRKCLCPTCGTKFRIPAATPPAAIAGLPLARMLNLDQTLVEGLPRAIRLDESLSPAPAVGPTDAPLAPTPSGQPAAGLHPSLSERPDLLWCLAFPGGEPTPPMPAESLQLWLDGDDAFGTELVWRSDWPEWRPVREVFRDRFK